MVVENEYQLIQVDITEVILRKVKNMHTSGARNRRLHEGLSILRSKCAQTGNQYVFAIHNFTIKYSRRIIFESL